MKGWKDGDPMMAVVLEDGAHFDFEFYQPKYVLSTPTTVYAADSLLGLIFDVILRRPVWRT